MTGRNTRRRHPEFFIVHHPVHQPGTEETAPEIMVFEHPPRLSPGSKLMIGLCATLAAYITGSALVALWKILL